MADDFIERAQVQLRELQEQDTHLANTQRGLEEQRGAMAAEMERITGAIEVYGRLMGVASGEPLEDQAPLLADDLKKMTIADGCEVIMRSQGGEAAAMMLLRTLQKIGKISRSKGSYGTIVRTLSRFGGRFYKVRPGRWGLVELRGDGRQPTARLHEAVDRIEERVSSRKMGEGR